MFFEDEIFDKITFKNKFIENACFENCDLMQATFFYSNLQGCDFSSSYNYCLDPEENTIQNAIFGATEVVGLLAKYDIIIK